MYVFKITNKSYHSLMSTGKYILKYEIGSTVHALPGTLGIMAFSTMDTAVRFREILGNILCNSCKILLLLPIGPTTCPNNVCLVGLDIYYARIEKELDVIDYSTQPPLGTICCQSAKVLKEIHQ